MKSRIMKKTIIPASILVLILLMLPSCFITSRAINVEVSDDEFNQNPHSMINDFEAEVGDKVTVKLYSNPSTGFNWSYEINGDSAIKEEDHDFEEAENGVPGAAGRDVWTFEAVEKGTAKVLMEYSQPWEGGIKRQWTYEFTVSVD